MPATEKEPCGQDLSGEIAGKTVATTAHATSSLTKSESQTGVRSESVIGDLEQVAGEATSKTPKRRRKADQEVNGDGDTGRSLKRAKIAIVKEEEIADEKSPLKQAKAKPRGKTVKVEEGQGKGRETPRRGIDKEAIGEKGDEEDADEGAQKKSTRKRKTKEEKEAEAMPLATRTHGLSMFVGAHVSCAKGVQNSVTNCVHIGGNAFAMFLKSQRKWENPPLQDEHREQFRLECGDHKFDATSHILPHGSYLVNLAQEEPQKASQAYGAFLDDMNRCEALGIKLYNFHPGSTGPQPRPSAIGRIAKALNRAHAATKTVVPVLETMASGGNVVGSTFEDLRDIIDLVDDKTRIGVCLDTCHVFAAGYDLRTPEAFGSTLHHFDEVIGIKYLRALHINDSKAPYASHRDLHQNIGLGFLGLRAFHNIMNEKRFEGLPLVLETPINTKDENGEDVEDKTIWAREIKMLETLIGMDAESAEFKDLEQELADKGAAERAKLQDAFDRKQEKDRKAMEKGQTKLMFTSQEPKKT